MTEQRIISRKEAKALGLKRYFTGVPCKRGHIAERNTAQCSCRECMNIAARKWKKNNGKKWRLANKDKVNALIKKWQERNPEKLKQYSARYYKKNPVKRYLYSIKWRKEHPEQYAAQSRRRACRETIAVRLLKEMSIFKWKYDDVTEALVMEHRKAISLGLEFYATGKPCKRGHFSPRSVRSCLCIDCYKERLASDRAYPRKRAKRPKRPKLAPSRRDIAIRALRELGIPLKILDGDNNP